MEDSPRGGKVKHVGGRIECSAAMRAEESLKGKARITEATG
jgi:hypothetical protein